MSGLYKISEEVDEIKKSLKFTQIQFDVELATVKSNINKVKSDMKEITEDLLDSDKVSSKFIELEDRPRRSNLRIDGIAEDQDESWHECEEKVLEVIKKKNQKFKTQLKFIGATVWANTKEIVAGQSFLN